VQCNMMRKDRFLAQLDEPCQLVADGVDHLEESVCECYKVVKDAYARLLGSSVVM
jgi:hypothetical protein